MKAELTRFRLGVLCPQPTDGTSLVRGIGPLAALARADRRLELDICPVEADGAPAVSWDWLVRCDALFLQRPQSAVHIAAAVTAKSFGRPVWVDWDDDLTCVPEHNPYRRLYEPGEMRALFGKLAHLADVVSVSTEALAERVRECARGTNGASAEMKKEFAASQREAGYQEREKARVRVIPNACAWRFTDAPRQRRVVWRGGKSHDADLLEFLPALRAVARLPQFGKWKWCFMGEIGPLVMCELRKAIPAENLEAGYADFVHQYMAAFGHLGPWLNIVPLQASAFNRAKSNLAWIEATCAGAITLAPDWPEWQRPGVVNYQGLEGFAEKLRLALGAFESPGWGADFSRDFIKGNLLLEQVNARRWEIIGELAEGLVK